MKRRSVAEADNTAMDAHLYAAAVEDLEFLAARGVGLTEAVRRVGWTAEAFEKWADRHQRRGLLAALLRNDRPAGSDVPAPVPVPRRGRSRKTSQAPLASGAEVA